MKSALNSAARQTDMHDAAKKKKKKRSIRKTNGN